MGRFKVVFLPAAEAQDSCGTEQGPEGPQVLPTQACHLTSSSTTSKGSGSLLGSCVGLKVEQEHCADWSASPGPSQSLPQKANSRNHDLGLKPTALAVTGRFAPGSGPLKLAPCHPSELWFRMETTFPLGNEDFLRSSFYFP